LLRPVVHQNPEMSCEALDLIDPVGQRGGGHNDQMAPELGDLRGRLQSFLARPVEPCQEGDSLHGLSQSHVIRELKGDELTSILERSICKGGEHGSRDV